MESSIENIDVSVDAGVDMDTDMIHSLFVLNDIIDKIVTNTFGSCDNKTYVKNISEFYINNEDYPLYRNIFPHGIYLEFSIYIQALLTKNISIIYNLRSVKLYDNDMVFCSCRAGVFKTDNFIIKIDTDSFNFKNEITCMYNIDKGLIKKYNIVLPYYSKINSKNRKTINFSIQPRIHDTISLRDWLLIYENQKLNIETYIKLCIQICKSIEFIHSKHIVHGDIKPDNILMEVKTNTPYIIDFGLSGLHGLSEGTGGTKPYCHPETKNIDDNPSVTEYNWVKNEKKNDVWSVSFIFACILIFRKCYTNYNNFPSDFFDENKYVNINYLNYIPKQYRTAFILSLSKNDNSCNNVDTNIDIQSFILLLERGLKS
jgi:serine/threonine protein kinase